MSSKRSIEGVYPYVLAVVAGAVFYWVELRVRPVRVAVAANFFGAISNVAAIAAGFLGTSLSVLYSIEDKPVVRDLKDADVWKLMMRYTMTALKWSLGLAAASAAGLFYADRLTVRYFNMAFAGWSLLAFVTAFTCIRVVHLFSRILTAK